MDTEHRERRQELDDKIQTLRDKIQTLKTEIRDLTSEAKEMDKLELHQERVKQYPNFLDFWSELKKDIAVISNESCVDGILYYLEKYKAIIPLYKIQYAHSRKASLDALCECYEYCSRGHFLYGGMMYDSKALQYIEGQIQKYQPCTCTCKKRKKM